MIYDLSKPLDRERFATRVKFLSDKQRMVELTDVSRRSSRQNAYLYTILTYFANELGESMEYVKEAYFKRMGHDHGDRAVQKVRVRQRMLHPVLGGA